MRSIILVAGAALALTACGNNGQAGNTTNVEQGLTAEDIVSNDVTAIDAVTGDAANMAADVDLSFTNDTDSNLANAATSARPAPKPSAEPETPTEATAANEAAATNRPAATNRMTSNETANSAE